MTHYAGTINRTTLTWRPPRLPTILLLGLAGAALILMLRHDSGTVLGMTTEDFSRLAALLADGIGHGENRQGSAVPE